MNVFLLGFMGSGKTTVGKLLAKSLDLSFVDMDDDIEKHEQNTIATIFEEKGEPYFRQLETQWLKNFEEKNFLISVGGGTPCYDQNLKLMKAKGVTVYLSMTPEMLTQRLFQAKNTRPVIEPYKADKQKLLTFVQQKLSERALYYEQADIIFEAGNFNASKKNLLTSMVKKLMADKNSLLQ